MNNLIEALYTGGVPIALGIWVLRRRSAASSEPVADPSAPARGAASPLQRRIGIGCIVVGMLLAFVMLNRPVPQGRRPYFDPLTAGGTRSDAPHRSPPRPQKRAEPVPVAAGAEIGVWIKGVLHSSHFGFEFSIPSGWKIAPAPAAEARLPESPDQTIMVAVSKQPPVGRAGMMTVIFYAIDTSDELKIDASSFVQDVFLRRARAAGAEPRDVRFASRTIGGEIFESATMRIPFGSSDIGRSIFVRVKGNKVLAIAATHLTAEDEAEVDQLLSQIAASQSARS